MTECEYCGEEGADSIMFVHDACLSEWDRRVHENECVYCGQDAGHGILMCGECGLESEFVGYGKTPAVRRVK